MFILPGAPGFFATSQSLSTFLLVSCHTRYSLYMSLNYMADNSFTSCHPANLHHTVET